MPESFLSSQLSLENTQNKNKDFLMRSSITISFIITQHLTQSNINTKIISHLSHSSNFRLAIPVMTDGEEEFVA